MNLTGHAHPDVALRELIERAELESAATTARQLRGLEATERLTTPAAEPPPLAAALEQTVHSLASALELLTVASTIDFRTRLLQHALGAVATCLDTAALTLTRAAAEARQAPHASTPPRARSALARQRFVAVIERREADIERDARTIERFSLTVADVTLEVSDLPVATPLPPRARSLIAGFDPPQRINTLQAALRSSRKTIPNLESLDGDDLLPMALDTHAHAIGASGSTARAISRLLQLSDAIRARRPPDPE